MDKNNLQDAAFGQWLKSRHLHKKHVFEGEEKRGTDYSKHYNKVENTTQLKHQVFGFRLRTEVFSNLELK